MSWRNVLAEDRPSSSSALMRARDLAFSAARDDKSQIEIRNNASLGHQQGDADSCHRQKDAMTHRGRHVRVRIHVHYESRSRVSGRVLVSFDSQRIAWFADKRRVTSHAKFTRIDASWPMIVYNYVG